MLYAGCFNSSRGGRGFLMGTQVRLPSTLLYPVEITNVLVSAQQEVKRQQRLLKFKYWNRVPDGVAEEGDLDPPLVTREFYGYFESPYDGVVTSLNVKAGDRINDDLAAVCTIYEGCDHSVQYGGLCALCGRSLDQKDYLGYSDVDRAPIAMSHGTSGLTVSRQEAERIETRSTKQLLQDKRLVLVVDLDQTVIHASVSPEIATWIADPESPRHELMKDVRSFSLRERPAAGGGASAPQPNGIPDQSWYFIKLRPGLNEFLEEMSSKYEMHVYTMATRQYALEVTKAIDPTGKYFADRILSRDTSGSLLHKDLKRLFPVSTNMVTIIDDRGDVWNWSPNLVRCVPYHFWSNTGDINSQFLPNRSGLVTPDQHGDQPEDNVEQQGDRELENVGKALLKLHKRFYEELEKVPLNQRNNDANLPDVGRLLPALKEQVFDGCVLLFSGFFPLGVTDLDSADIVQWVRSFGAVVVANYLPSVTHVVSRNPGTMKARQAAGHGKCVVQIEWVFKCLEKWRCVDETPYLWDVPNPVTGDEPEEVETNTEVDANIANGFVRSLQRGDVNWDAMDEELNELLGNDDSDEEEDGNEDSEKESEEDSEDSGKEHNVEDNIGPDDNVNKDADQHRSDQNKADQQDADQDPDNSESLKRKRDESEFEIDLEEDWD